MYRLLSNHKYSQFWQIWETQWAQKQGIQLSQHFKNVFVSLVCFEPHHRLSITELKFHPYLSETRALTRSQTGKVKAELNEVFFMLKQ